MVNQDDLPIYPIRTVASLTGVDARRLRSWESEYHLLEPARSKGGHRLYSPRDLRLVQLIRRLVDQEGMSLQGIKAFLAAQPDLTEAPAARTGPQAQGASRTPPGAGSGAPVPDETSGGHNAAQPASRGAVAAEPSRAPAKVVAAPQAGASAGVPLAARQQNGHGRTDRR